MRFLNTLPLYCISLCSRYTNSVVAIELLAACQALDLRKEEGLLSTKPLQAVHALVRGVVEPYDKDRVFTEDIEAVTKLLQENKVGNSSVECHDAQC